MQLLSFIPDSMNGIHYLKFIAAMVLGIVIVSVVARLFFGKQSTLNRSVSGSLGILSIYAVHVILYCAGVRFPGLLTSLPCVALEGESLVLFQFVGSSLTAICQQVLDMLILALVMVILDNLIPQGKKFIPWLGLRLVSVVLGIAAHYLLRLLLDAVIPEGILTFAPAVLIIVLVFSLLLGTLKLIIGGALAFISPVLAVLYAFFFNNVIGKQVRKAILTTAILSGLVILLNYLGIGTIALGSALLLVYLPILLIALALWFLISRLF